MKILFTLTRVTHISNVFPILVVSFISQCTVAMLGYAEEDQTTVLELAYSYAVTEYTKGNAYAQVNISPSGSISDYFFI